MAQLILLMGSIGSGKSYYCANSIPSFERISQDDQGKENHKVLFKQALEQGKNIVVDRQNHLRDQRRFYLDLAKQFNYETKIVYLKTNKDLCEKRALERKNHPSISPQDNIRRIINMFNTSVEYPSRNEADEVEEIVTKYYASIEDLSHLRGRIAVVGDLHGVYDELKKALDEIKPDHIVFTGDVVDRGPKILECIKLVRENYSVIGNHDQKLARALIGNKVSLSGGIEQTLEQIKNLSEQEKEEMYEWIQKLPCIIKLPKDYVVVHAGFTPTRPLDKQSREACFYIRTHGSSKMNDTSMPMWYKYDLCDDLKKYKILFGHSIHEEFEVAPNVFSLDKGAVYGTGLRILVIDTNGEDKMKEFETKVYYVSEYEPERNAKAFKVPVGNGKVEHIKQETFEQYKQDKFLSQSETEDLILFNYSDHATYSKMWDEVTLNSRGTVYEKQTGNVVATAFKKFFNLNEHLSTKLENLPLHFGFLAFEKSDGSMGNVFKYKGEWKVSTRGSFFSDQAKKAQTMLSKYKMDLVPENVNLIIEIIYPANRIVVDYGAKEELVLLSAFDNKKLEELSWEETKKIAELCEFPLPKVYSHSLDELVELAKTIPFQEEGWVLRFKNNLRVKIKGEDYLRIAKIKSHMSPLSFWEAMTSEKLEVYIESIPEELREEADMLYNKLKGQLTELKLKVDSEVQKLGLNRFNPKDKNDMKEAALLINKLPVWMRGYIFQSLRGQADELILAKLLRPTENIFINLDSLQ